MSDNTYVRHITSLLESAGRVEGNPIALKQNGRIAFQGCVVLGKGFILDPEEAETWITKDPRYQEVVFPYLNGEDLNSSPDCSASRWIIDFGERGEDTASSYSVPWKRVQERVRPEREQKDGTKYPRMVYEWWKFWNSRPGLRKAISELDEVLAIARVSNTVMPVRVSPKQTFSEQTIVFATGSYAVEAVLSSSFHYLWAVKYASTIGAGAGVRYTPTDVFETFPSPEPTDWIHRVGRTLDAERREFMLRRSVSLTDTYNLINDPRVNGVTDSEIGRLRDIHVELDDAVADSYGWSDISLGHGFHTYRKMQRWTVSPAARVEILDRLLEENHRRAAEEAKQTRPTRSKGRRGKSASDDQGTLL